MANYHGFTGDITQKSDIDVFVPELWADGVYRYFEKNLVFKPFFDDYSSLVQKKGDVLHIPTVQEVATDDKAANTSVDYTANVETDIDLAIDQHKYAAKLFEDIAIVQANEQLFDKYSQSMGYALGKAVDTKIEALLQTLGTTQTLAVDNSLSNADVETALGTMLTNDIPQEECAFFVNPLIYADLLNSKAFVTNNSGAGVGFGNDNSVMATGQVGLLFGIPVFTSSLIGVALGTGTHAGYLCHKSSIAVAVQQATRVQANYDVSYLGTKVVADIIFGAVITTSNHIKGIELLNP
tara:strand:+ start:3811 stop:4695 length:885 start_codon:yes stop_codon:yes gene_type:complete